MKCRAIVVSWFGWGWIPFVKVPAEWEAGSEKINEGLGIAEAVGARQPVDRLDVQVAAGQNDPDFIRKPDLTMHRDFVDPGQLTDVDRQRPRRIRPPWPVLQDGHFADLRKPGPGLSDGASFPTLDDVFDKFGHEFEMMPIRFHDLKNASSII